MSSKWSFVVLLIPVFIKSNLKSSGKASPSDSSLSFFMPLQDFAIDDD